jgi:hypothetical protein
MGKRFPTFGRNEVQVFPTDSVSTVSVIRGSPRTEKYNLKLNKHTFRKFQNARQARTGRNMVKFNSPNAFST